MKLFVYSLRDFDEKELFEKFSQKYGIEYGWTHETPTIDTVNLSKGYDTVDILTSTIDKKMLDLFHENGVRCIATRTIGYDHIDVNYAKQLGIGVINVAYSPSSVADYTIMMMLMGLRKVKVIKLRADAQDFSLKGKIAKELPNCTVGIIGTGRIGSRVIKDLSGFGCRMLAYDPFEKDEVKKTAQYADLDTIYKECDIITLHAPLTNDNYHMLDENAFSKMKDGIGIVNCARGALIDSNALIRNVESGKVGFACLDVVENEMGLYYFNRMGDALNNQQLAILQSFPNVIVMPHMAFYTDEAVSNMVENSILGAMNFYKTGKCVYS